MTEYDAWVLVKKRAAANPGVEYSQEALQAAVDRLLGRKPSGRPEPVQQPVKERVSPFAVSSRGLHEKYSPENRA